MSDLEAARELAERMRAVGLGVIVASEPDGWEVEITTTEDLYQRGYRGVYRKGATVAQALHHAADYVLGGRGADAAANAPSELGGESGES